jgi:hypothetical protein
MMNLMSKDALSQVKELTMMTMKKKKKKMMMNKNTIRR